MARRKAMMFRKTNTSQPLDQSCLQSSLDDRLEPEDQYNAQLSANSSASTGCSILSADSTSTDNINITKPIEDGTLVKPIQVNQAAIVPEAAVQSDQVAQAQRIIAGAARAKETEQNKAIDEAIQLLYPYAPREGQRNALRQLIYKRKDLILCYIDNPFLHMLATNTTL